MRLPGWALLVGAVLLVFLSLRIFGCQRERQGEIQARLKQARIEFSALQRRMRAVDTVYVRDTVRFTKLRTRYDTLLVDRRITDTMWVRRLIQVGDSTIDACSDALGSCGAQVAVRDSMLFNLRTQVKTLEKRKAKRWGCAGPGVVTRKGVELGIGCGFVIHF